MYAEPVRYCTRYYSRSTVVVVLVPRKTYSCIHGSREAAGAGATVARFASLLGPRRAVELLEPAPRPAPPPLPRDLRPPRLPRGLCRLSSSVVSALEPPLTGFPRGPRPLLPLLLLLLLPLPRPAKLEVGCEDNESVSASASPVNPPLIGFPLARLCRCDDALLLLMLCDRCARFFFVFPSRFPDLLAVRSRLCEAILAALVAVARAALALLRPSDASSKGTSPIEWDTKGEKT